MSLRRLWKRGCALFERRHLDQELEDEIRAHLELAERDARSRGLSPDDARTAARRAFGGVDRIREEHRDARGVAWLETLARDARYGLAACRRDPAFTLVAVGVLALGIGANAAMFSLLDAALLKPLPFAAPDRIVRVWEAPRPGVTNSTSTLDFLDWKRMGSSFEALAAESEGSMALTGNGEAVRLPASAVTADFFDVFAVRPAIGRTFVAADDQPGAAPVVVLSHAVWQTYFGGDRDILGRRPVLDGQPYQVIGVLPAGVFDQTPSTIWTPLVFTPDQYRRDFHWLSVAGRLRPGVSPAQARGQLRALRAAQRATTPAFKRGWSIEVEPLDRLLVGDTLRRSVTVAAGAVLIVLLIACANVANLLLARGVTRRRELAIRVALGAGRGRLVAQMLTESAVLCLLGAAAGIALAWALVRAARPALADVLPASVVVSVDGRVLAFTLSVALGAAMLVGVLPALQASFRGIAAAAGGSGRGSTAARGTIRRVLVAAEVGMSVVLLCGALLLFVTLANLQQLDPGVRIDDVMTMSLDLPQRTYGTAERAVQFDDALVERVEAAPGVERAALTTFLPLRWVMNGENIRVAGVDEPINVRFKRVGPGYFETLDIPLIAGRGFTPLDRAGTEPVAVINEALAARLRDAADMPKPVGRALTLAYADYAGQPVTAQAQIVGVIRSERVGDPWRPDPPVLYVPMLQAPNGALKLVVRTQGASGAAMRGVRQAVHAVDPNLPIGDVESLAEVRDRTYLFASRPAWLIGAFAVMAVLLASLGLYGVLAHAVAEGRREIGIRLALGAAARRVVWSTVAAAARMIAVGLAIGVVAAAGVTRVMRGMLFGVSPVDPRVLAAAAAAMAVVGVIAALLPARRAATVDPMVVLREDG